MNRIFLLTMILISNVILGQAPVKIGIAGMTHDHVNTILQTPTRPGMQLVGFAEPNKELAMRLLLKNKLPASLWFPSLSALIAATKPQAICDFRSTYEHLETVQECAPRGIHVMVEKPLAVNKAHAVQMQALATKHSIHIITNFETTWYPSHYDAKKIVEAGRLGPITKMVILDGHRGPKEIGCSAEFLEWLTDPVKNGGGAIMDFGCYGANLMTWFMNGQKPISVFAMIQTHKPDIYPRVDDEATILVQYPGAQGIFQASWNWPFDRKDTEIYGQQGYLFANRSPQFKIRIGSRNSTEEQQIAKPLIAPNDDPFSYLAGVVNGSIDPKGHLGSLEVNMITMEILDAAVRSAKAKKTIYLK
jgi:predicted dehydrogenase